MSLTILPTFLYLPEDYQEVKKEYSFDVGAVLKNRRIVLLSLVVMMTSAGTTYLNPMFTLHMETYGLEEYLASLVLGSCTVSYVISILFVPALSRVFDKKIIICMGCVLAVLGDLVIAPLPFIPNEWWIVLVGLPLIGVANAMCVLPCIPQYIQFMSQFIAQ
jgi:MFS family permease